MELNQEYCNEFDDLKVEKLPLDVFNTLAYKLKFHWQQLARYLNISDKEIDMVLMDFKNTNEQIYAILNGWCRKNPNKKWRDIKSGLIICNRIDVISECERKLSIHSVFGVKPSSEKLFPRDKELHKIHQYFLKAKDIKGSTLVLYGMSGVGKTQIARKYCETYRNFYRNIVWIDASFTKLQASMNNLCHILGLIVQDSKENYFNIEVITEKIHNYFKNEKTLYIFDNVADESVRNLEIYISKKPNSFTLITSQWRTWSNSVYKMLINVFSSEDAYVYVKNNVKENNDENIRNLIKELGYHPFAITQAIKYIKLHEISIEKYIAQYRSKPLEMLDNYNFPTEEESNSAIKAITIVLIKLEKSKMIALQILNFLSHCDGQNISKQFIIDISKHLKINEEYLMDEAIELLKSCSLLDCLNDEKYSIHKLTQLSCIAFQKKNFSINLYLDLIESYFKSMLDKVIDHVNYGNHFVIHFLHLFRTNQKRMSNVFCRSAIEINRFLTSKGLFQEAIEILKVVQCFNEETYGDNNEITIDTKFNIALCLNNMGKYNQALEIYYSVDKIKTEILGISHPSTLDIKNNIARCLYDMGRYNEALEIHYSVVKLLTEVLGIYHPSAMKTKNNIANCLVNMGKYNEALEIYYSVDKIQTEILGINHPHTMTTKNNMANCLKEVGKFNEALEILYPIDKIGTDVLEINNLLTIDIKCTIGHCFLKLGKYMDAIDIFYFVHKMQTEILGVNHPSTIRTKSNIANCLVDMGKYNEALEIYYSVDKIQTEILGINHPHTMTTKNNIADCLNNMGKYDEALEIFYSVDKVQTEILGINHPFTMDTKNNIALCLGNMGKYNEALEIYYSVDKIKTEILGINHPSAMTTKNNIALCLYDMGKYNEALEIHYSVDKIQTEILGINHQHTMITKNNIAKCLKEVGKFNEALEILYPIDKIGTHVLGINNLLTIDIKCTIGHCFLKLGKYVDAIDIFYFVHKMQTEILGVNHPSSMRTKSNIGVCLQNLDNCLVESNRKNVSDKHEALKCFYLMNYQKVYDLRPPLNVAFSVDILNEFVELCLVDAGDVQMDAAHRVELMEFLKKQKNYKTIQYNKVFMHEKSLLLISGIAGIGKSWLLKKCLLDWANNQIWKKVDFVFYFECRMLNYYENISNIKELLYVFYKDFVSDLDIRSHNILFVIDGLDEFKYLDDLINYNSSSQYPIVKTLAEIQNFKSVVAGRVYAIDCYQSVYRMPTVNSNKLTIQIMGFNDNGISNYIENNVIEEKKEFLKSLFKDNPIAKAMASVPFYLSIMCKIIVESNERDFSFLTMTGLYASIFLHFLKSHITKSKIPIYRIMENENNKQDVLNVCKIAYILFVENKVIFSKNEIQMFISDFDEVEDKLFGFIERFETDLGYCYHFAHVTIMEFCASVYAYNNFSGEEIVVNKKLRSCLSMICGLSNKNHNSLLKFLVNLNNKQNEKLSMVHVCDLLRESYVKSDLERETVNNSLFIECFYESQSSFDEIKSFTDERDWSISVDEEKTSYETSCENYFVNYFIKYGRKLRSLFVRKNFLSDEEKHLIMQCSNNVRNVVFFAPIIIEGWKPKGCIEMLSINIHRYLISKKEYENFLPWINLCEILYIDLHDDIDFLEDIIEWIRCSNIKKLTIEYRGKCYNNLDEFKIKKNKKKQAIILK